MPAYTKLNLSELREECDERGINYAGLTKKGIISLLRRDDERLIREKNNDVEDDAAEIEDEIVMGAGAADRRSDSESVASQSPVLDAGDGTSPEADSVRIMELKLALVKEQREREREQRESERERDERARLAREREFEIEKERAGLRDGSRGPVPARPMKPEIQSVLPRMSNDDPLVFFQSYERALLLNDVEKSQWSKFLPANLTPKANKVLAGLSLQDVKDYELCKRAILSYFQLNGEAYLKKFRSARKAADENYKMFANRLKDCFLYYVESKEIDSFESLADAVVCEQFLCALPDDVKKFVLARQPKTADECSNLADVFHELSRNVGGQNQSGGPAQGPSQGSGQAHTQAKTQGQAATSQYTQRFAGPKPTGGGSQNPNGQGARKQVVCYACQTPGHKYADCPQRNQYNASFCVFCSCFHPHNVGCNQRPTAANAVYAAARNDEFQRQQQRRQQLCISRQGRTPVIPIYVNGKGIWALRDTGCQGPTLIHPKYVDQGNYTGEHILLKGAFDGPNESRKVPLAVISLRAPSLLCDDDVSVTVGVWPLAEFQCILGNSLFEDNSQFTDIFTSQHADRKLGTPILPRLQQRVETQQVAVTPITHHDLSNAGERQTAGNEVITEHRGGSVSQGDSDNENPRYQDNHRISLDNDLIRETDRDSSVGQEISFDAAPAPPIGENRPADTTEPCADPSVEGEPTTSEINIQINGLNRMPADSDSREELNETYDQLTADLEGVTDMSTNTVTQDVDGNLPDTVSVTTRAKRRETDTLTPEPGDETEDQWAVYDDGGDESDFDQVARQLSDIDVTDGNFDENEETRADTETARQFAEAQQNDESIQLLAKG